MIYNQGTKAGRAFCEGKEIAQIWAEGKQVFQRMPDGGQMVWTYAMPADNSGSYFNITVYPLFFEGADPENVTDCLVEFPAGAYVDGTTDEFRPAEKYHLKAQNGYVTAPEGFRHAYPASMGAVDVKITGKLVGGLGSNSGAAMAYLKGISLPTNNSPLVDVRDYAFAGAEISSLPALLFANCSGAKSFKYTFNNCPFLASIPATLFDYNTLAEDFEGTFANCKALAAVPTGLFSKNTQASSFRNTFYGGSKISSMPSNLFATNSKASDFYRCFYISSGGNSVFTGALPALWDMYPSAVHTSCFYGYSFASNYATAVQKGWYM